MKRFVKIKINGHIWSVRRLKPEDMGNGKYYGYTWIVHRAIDLMDTLTEDELPYVIRHEVCHAILDTQGRRVQNKFNVEEICDFVAWNNEEISRLTNEIVKKILEK